jgi:hypothetical protein
VPYQVIFFSSGDREEKWTSKSIGEMRMNTVIGFPLRGLLSIAIMYADIPVLQPAVLMWPTLARSRCRSPKCSGSPAW